MTKMRREMKEKDSESFLLLWMDVRVWYMCALDFLLLLSKYNKKGTKQNIMRAIQYANFC